MAIANEIPVTYRESALHSWRPAKVLASGWVPRKDADPVSTDSHFDIKTNYF
jgi:hypothetical protein